MNEKVTISDVIHAFNVTYQTILDKVPKNEISKEYNVSLIILIQSMVKKFESIELLLDNDQVDSINLLQRPILESSFFIDYILQDENDVSRRGNAMFYSYKMQAGKKVKNMCNTFPNKEEALQVKKGIDSHLKSEDNSNYEDLDSYIDYYSNEYKKYFTLKEGKGAKQQLKNWYNQSGRQGDLRALSNNIGRGWEYDLYYSTQSLSIHPNGEIANLAFDDGVLKTSNSISRGAVERYCIDYILNGFIRVGTYFEILPSFVDLLNPVLSYKMSHIFDPDDLI